MDILWKTLCTASAAWLLTTGSLLATTDGLKSEMKMEKSLNLTHEWDKVFPLSNKVNHRKVTFTNRYGITLAADMYVPKQAEGKLPAIAVSGPFGAVKEQSSGLYAMTLAERGFLTIAFDPSYTGPVRVGANPAMWRLRTSIRRTSVRRWTSFLFVSR